MSNRRIYASDRQVYARSTGTGHYFFHILENGISVPDDEGMFLSRLAAQAELQASVRDLAGARMRAGHGPGDGLVQLTNLGGDVLEILPFRKVLH